MSTPEETVSRISGVKTLAIRLEPDIHAQLSLIAQLREGTITDEIRAALAAHIAAAKDATDLTGRADDALAEIERDAAAKREAIATLFATQPAAATPDSDGSRRGRAPRRSGKEDDSTDS